MSCSTLLSKRCQLGFVTMALACPVFPMLDLVGWRRRVMCWRSLVVRTLDRVLIASVAVGMFILAVRCDRLWRQLRHRVMGVSVVLFEVWLSDGHGGAWLGSSVSTLGTCCVSTLGTCCELRSFHWLR